MCSYVCRVRCSSSAQWIRFCSATEVTLESAQPEWAFPSPEGLPKWNGGQVGVLVKLCFQTNSQLNEYPLNKFIEWYLNHDYSKNIPSINNWFQNPTLLSHPLSHHSTLGGPLMKTGPCKLHTFERNFSCRVEPLPLSGT